MTSDETQTQNALDETNFSTDNNSIPSVDFDGNPELNPDQINTPKPDTLSDFPFFSSFNEHSR